MDKLKKKSKGRPQYVPDTKQLRQLYFKVKNKEITNEQAWTLARLQAQFVVQNEKGI